MVHSLERKNEMKNIGNIKMIFFLGYALGIYQHIEFMIDVANLIKLVMNITNLVCYHEK